MLFYRISFHSRDNQVFLLLTLALFCGQIVEANHKIGISPSSETQGQLVRTFAHENPVVPTSCPWVSEDGISPEIWAK